MFYFSFLEPDDTRERSFKIDFFPYKVTGVVSEQELKELGCDLDHAPEFDYELYRLIATN